MFKYETTGSHMCSDILLIYSWITPFRPVILLAIPGGRRKSQSRPFFPNNQQGDPPKTSEESLESIPGLELKIIRSSWRAHWCGIYTPLPDVFLSPSLKSQHDSQETSAAQRLAWVVSDRRTGLGAESWTADVGIRGTFFSRSQREGHKCTLCGLLKR